MAGSYYSTQFKFAAVGLQKVLTDFQKTAAQIKSESQAIGKMNFAGLNSAIPTLKNINKELLQISKNTKTITASSAKLGSSFGPMSAGATKAAASTKSIEASMKQLGVTAGTTSTTVGKVKTSFTGLGTTGKSVFSAIVSGARSAATAVGSIAGAAGTATRSLGGMSIAAASSGMAKGMARLTSPLAAGALAAYGTAKMGGAVAAGYGLYKSAEVERYASEAAAKSWTAGMSKEDLNAIKQTVIDVSKSGAGQSIYGADEKAELLANYAAMGGDVKNADAGLVSLLTNYAQAIGGELGTSTEDLISQNMMWYQGSDAFKQQNLKTTADMNAVLLAQTKLSAEDMMDLSKSGAPVANTYGMSQAEYLASAGTLAQMGRSPEQASNDIRRILLRGTPSITQQQKMEAYEAGVLNDKGELVDAEGKKLTTGNAANEALSQLGMTWSDLDVQKAGGLPKLMETLSEKMKEANMSDLDQQAWMKTIYGIQGVTPTAMLAQGGDFATKLQENLEKASEGEGAAKTMSDTQTDNLWGSVKKLMANLEVSFTSLGDKLSPFAKKLADYANTNIVPGMNQLGSSVLAGDWKGAAGMVGGAYDVVKEKGSEVFGDISSFLTDEGNWSAWGDILKGVIETVQDDILSLTDSFKEFISGGAVSNLLSGATNWISDVLSAFDGFDWSKIFSNLIDTWSSYLVQIMNYISDIDYSSIGTKVGNALESAATWLLDKLVSLPWSEFTTTLINAVDGGLKGVKSLVISIDWVQLVKDVGRAALMIVGAIGIGLADTDFAKYMVNSIANIYNKFVDLGSDIVGAFAYVGIEVGNAIVRGVSYAAEQVMSFVNWIYDKVGAAVRWLSGESGTGNGETAATTIDPDAYYKRIGKEKAEPRIGSSLPSDANPSDYTMVNVLSVGDSSSEDSSLEDLLTSYGVGNGDIKRIKKIVSARGGVGIGVSQTDDQKQSLYGSKGYYDEGGYRYYSDGSMAILSGGVAEGRMKHDTSSGTVVSYDESGQETGTTKTDNTVASTALEGLAGVNRLISKWTAGEQVDPNAAAAETKRLFQQIFPYWKIDETKDDDLDPAREELKKIEENTADTTKNTENLDSTLQSSVDASKSAAESASGATEASVETTSVLEEAISTMNEGWKWATDYYKTRGRTNEDGGWAGESWEYIPYLEESGQGGKQIYSTLLSLTGKINGLGSISGYQGLPQYATQEMVNQALTRIKPSLDEAELQKIGAYIESQGFSAKVLLDVDDSQLVTAKNDAKQPTWSYHTIYVNEKYKTLSGKSSSNDFGADLSNFKSSDITTAKFNIPKFAEGGYTGNYEGLAYLHPNETIIPGGKVGNNVTVNVDLRGAIVDKNTVDVLSEAIANSVKEKLQGEMYR